MYKQTCILKYDDLEIEPTPQISIDREPIYVGENIIGYNHVINLKGYASSVLYSQGRMKSNTRASMYSLDAIQKILQRNGKTLTLENACTAGNVAHPKMTEEPIMDVAGGALYITAHGGHLKSFNTEEGDWYNYIKYNASLEFSDLYVNGQRMGVSLSNMPVVDPVTMLYLTKLKSFEDKWTFTVPEQEAYLYYARLVKVGEDEVEPTAEDYTQIQVQYTITGRGKHFYKGVTSDAALENAKNFVQHRLYHQIDSLHQKGVLNGAPMANVFYNSNDPGLPTNQSLTSTVFSPVVPPILDTSITDKYKIYNETIDCSTSESEGSFSATYSCILKRYDPSIAALKHSVHTFTANYEQTNSFKETNRTFTISGEVQGLLPTEILNNIDDGQSLMLPMNGLFFNITDDQHSKYYYAWEDAIGYLFNKSLDDLSDRFKKTLDINYASLFPDTQPDSPCLEDQGFNWLYQKLAEPKSFSISHNYKQGSVNYTATYDTQRSCVQALGFNSITITEKDSLPKYVEHLVVGRKNGPILQDLNTNSPKTVTIDFDGVTRKGCAESGNPFSEGYELQDPRFTGISADVCDTDSYIFIPTIPELIFESTELGARLLGGNLIQRSYNASYNPVDGSYDVSKSYIVCPPKPEQSNNEDC